MNIYILFPVSPQTCKKKYLHSCASWVCNLLRMSHTVVCPTDSGNRPAFPRVDDIPFSTFHQWLTLLISIRLFFCVVFFLMFQATGVVQLSKAFWVVQNRLSHQKAGFGDRAPWSLSGQRGIVRRTVSLSDVVRLETRTKLSHATGWEPFKVDGCWGQWLRYWEEGDKEDEQVEGSG